MIGPQNKDVAPVGGGRRPPAYQEYGGDLLGQERVRLMTAAERGLLASMRWSCWANDSVPREPAKLARVLGLDVDEVRAALTPGVLSFFQTDPNDAGRLICPELVAQFERLHARQKERADSGMKGGKVARAKERHDKAQLEAELKLAEKSRAEKSRDEKRRTELARESGSSLASSSDFVREYEAVQERVG